MAKVLTARAVETMKPEDKRREVPDGVVPGLYLVIQPSGAKSWAVRYRHGGKPRKLTLGPFPLLGLAAAREKAREALGRVSEGFDPGAEKASRKAGEGTVREAADLYLARQAAGKRSEAHMVRSIRGEIIPRWSSRRLDSLTRRDLIALMDDLSAAGKPGRACTIFAYTRAFLRWCVQRDMIEHNPAEGLPQPARIKPRERVLEDGEIRALWQAAGALGYPYGPCARFLLITGQRRMEVARMRWSDVSGNVWTIPAEHSKNGHAHALTLPRAALALLEGLPRLGPFVFTGRSGHISSFGLAKAKLDRLIGDGAKAWRFHDLRRTAATGMARAGARLEVVEKVLNHRSGSFSGIVAVYQRHSYEAEMRAALEGWAGLLERIAEGAQADVIYCHSMVR